MSTQETQETPTAIVVDDLPEHPLHMDIDQAVAFAGQLLQTKNSPAAAKEVLRAVLRIEPNYALAHELYAIACDEFGEMEEAVAAIEAAIEIDADDASRWNNFGNILIGAGQPKRARAAYEHAIALAPEMAQPHSNLGTVLRLMDEPEASEVSLKRAIELDPRHHAAWHNLAKLYFDRGRRQEGIEASMRAVTIRPQNAYRNFLGQAFALLGDTQEALRTYERWHAEEPDNPVPMLHIKALLKDAPNRCSDEYVKQIFDNFAKNFEAKLKVLEYRAPELVQRALEAVSDAPAGQYAILDAGCGTGWCAEGLRPFASHLEGVDLSAGMLERAAQLGLYDTLVEGELTEFLDERLETYDRIVICDTFCYFGDLKPAAAAAFKAMRPGGALVATFEAMTDATPEDTFDLHVSGRYTHAGDYVDAAFREAGFEVVRRDGDWLREEFAKPVHGWIITVRKP